MRLDLERLSVMVVDDSQFIRTLVINALKAIGVGQVTVAEEGGAAIETLTRIHRDPVRAGIMGIDMIISNWEMAPVNGPMLLRWIRRHKDSPDRFLPFLLLTAYSEAARITEAREMGAHDIMAKPFNIRTLSDKISGVILRNRQFVHTKDFFGPDRRRQALRYTGPERRILTDKSPETEVIYL